MEEKELLEWIDDLIEGTNESILDISNIAQRISLSEVEADSYLMLNRDVAILNKIRTVVFSWYQERKAMKEG